MTSQKTTKILRTSFKPTVTQTRNPLPLQNTNFITMFIKISTEPDPEVQSVHTLVPPFSKIHCNTNLTSIPRSIKQSLPEWFSIYLTCQKNSKTYTVVNKNVPACFQKALLQGDCYMGRSNRAVAHDYLCLIILRAQVNDHISSVLMLSSDWVRSWKRVNNRPTVCS